MTDSIPLRTLLTAYANGIFPMADSRDTDEIYWIEPQMRAILPLHGFRLAQSLRRTVRKDKFTVTADRCFAETVRACAAPAPGREGTWINRVIEASYAELFARGFAHSVECWLGDDLVGGLYGVSLGRAFFGESMFSRRTDASKVALAWLVARLKIGGYTVLDCQFMTDHLASLGAVEIPQADYLRMLYPAVGGVGAAAGGPGGGASGAADGGGAVGSWGALDGSLGGAARGDDAAASSSGSIATSPGQVIVQLLTNTS